MSLKKEEIAWSEFTQKVLAGVLIGIGFLLPGVSGGVMAISMGVYEPMIKAVSHIFEDFKKNIKYLLPLGLGAGIGAFITVLLLNKLLSTAQDQVMFLFAGLVLGGVPALWKEANGRAMKRMNLFALLMGLACSLFLILLEKNTQSSGVAQTIGIWQATVAGGIMAVGSVVPGISSSFILMHMDLYRPLVNAFSTLQVGVILFAGVGFAVVTLLGVRVVEWLFKRHRDISYHVALGFLLGSLMLILPFGSMWGRWYLNLPLLLIGVALTMVINRGFGRMGAKA